MDEVMTRDHIHEHTADVGDPPAMAVIRYSGDSSALTIRSEWQDLGGDHPVMVNAAPAN